MFYEREYLVLLIFLGSILNGAQAAKFLEYSIHFCATTVAAGYVSTFNNNCLNILSYHFFIVSG